MENWEAEIRAAFYAGVHYAIAQTVGKGMKADDADAYIAKLKARPLVVRFNG